MKTRFSHFLIAAAIILSPVLFPFILPLGTDDKAGFGKAIGMLIMIFSIPIIFLVGSLLAAIFLYFFKNQSRDNLIIIGFSIPASLAWALIIYMVLSAQHFI